MTFIDSRYIITVVKRQTINKGQAKGVTIVYSQITVDSYNNMPSRTISRPSVKRRRRIKTGLNKFYVVDTDTSRITLAQNESRSAELVIPQIVAKLMGREVLDWLTLDVMHHMNNVFDFQVISPPE